MATESERHRKADTSELDYQSVRDNFRAVLLTVAAVFLLLFIAQFILWETTHRKVARLGVTTQHEILQLPAGGVILETQEQKLSAYGWVDKSKGIAHIPVERAMQLLADHPGKQFLPGMQAEGSRR